MKGLDEIYLDDLMILEESTEPDPLIGIPGFNGTGKYTKALLWDWDLSLRSDGLIDSLTGAPEWLVDGHSRIEELTPGLWTVTELVGDMLMTLGQVFTREEILALEWFTYPAESDTRKSINGGLNGVELSNAI